MLLVQTPEVETMGLQPAPFSGPGLQVAGLAKNTYQNCWGKQASCSSVGRLLLPLQQSSGQGYRHRHWDLTLQRQNSILVNH
jgi:hypothetical protein